MESKYQVIKHFLLQKIESGEWPERTSIPSENALADQFNVSRMTSRRALQDLAAQGVIIRTQGANSEVASIKSQSSLIAIRNIADEIAERGHQYTAQMLKLEQASASKKIALQLGMEVGDAVFLSVICHLENKVPVQLEERYVNPDVVPDYLNQDFTQLTPHTYLSRIAPLTEAHHQIEAVLPEQAIASHLSIALSEPCLQVLRRTWSKTAVVSYAKLTHPGSRYRLGGHLTF